MLAFFVFVGKLTKYKFKICVHLASQAAKWGIVFRKSLKSVQLSVNNATYQSETTQTTLTEA